MSHDIIMNSSDIFEASLKGLRNQNEDTHVIITNIDNRDNTIKDINFFAINDGHGGKQVSEFIKEVLPSFFLDNRVEYPLKKRYVTNVYDHIQKLLSKQPYTNHCGSTSLTVIKFNYNNDSYLNVINLGDCRCILNRDNFAMPLTKDHKPNWPEEYNRINQIGGKVEFDGFDWRINDLSVSRAFGDLDATPGVSHKPDLFRYKLDKNDKFIIMGCDGLYDVLSNSDIINFVLMHCYDNTTTKRINHNMNIAKKLAEHAIKLGSTDNVSCIVIFLD